MKMVKVTPRWLSLIAVLVLLLTTSGVALAQGGMITGTVALPEGGSAPAGTVVKLFEPGGWDVLGQANVAPDGTFSLGPVPNGLYVLKAVPPSGSGCTQSEPISVSVFNAPVDVGTMVLTEPEIYGTVTAPDGLTPAPAEVWVLSGSGLPLQRLGAPGGDFLVGGLPAGGYGLRASPTTDDAYWHSPVTLVSVNGHTQTITLTLTAADIYGTVNDHLGNPVPEAAVTAVKTDGEYHQRRDLTSPTGAYAIGDLITGTYRLQAEPPWYEGALLPSLPISFTIPGASPPYTLTFRAPPKVVTGTVTTNTGDPVRDALVVAHRLDKGGRVEALSDPLGGYRLDLSDGLWALTVKPISATMPSAWVYPDPPQLVHFQHNREPEHKRMDFSVITADAHVVGAVDLPGGGTLVLPLTVTVSLRNDEGIGRQAVVTVTGGSGGGSFDIAIPHGGYKVWVAPEDPGYMGPVVEPILVPPNGSYDLGTLTLLERDAIITGTVSDEGGLGVGGIPISAWRPGAPGGARTVTGPKGQYVLSVVAGEWHVQPSPGPDQPYIYTGPGARVTVTSTGVVSDVDFSLVSADGTISGRLVDEAGNLVTDAEGWANAVHIVTPALHNGAPIQAGTFDIHVPRGLYRVAVHLPAGGQYMSTGERAVAVISGTVGLTLTVKEKDARITGGLWDPRNEDVVDGVDAAVLAWAGGNWVGTAVQPNGAFTMSVASGLWHLGYRVDPQSNYVGLRHHKNIPVASGQTVKQVPLPVAPRDGVITGTVVGSDGDPLVGARVNADGIGPVVGSLWLSTRSGDDGRFHLRVPYGDYHLGATVGITNSIKPALRRVSVPVNGVSGGHVLRFRWPDAVISGTVSISTTSTQVAALGTGLPDRVFIWGWSEDDAFVKTRVPVTDSVGSYSLDVISNTTWHVGAVYETPSQYWLARETVVLGEAGATQDLVLMGPHPKPAPVMVTFDSSLPQRVSLADGTSIYIPAGAMPVEGQVTLHVLPIATLPHQRHANIYRYGYAFAAVDEAGQPITQHFNQEVVVGFAYEERELWVSGINEHLLKPAYFSTTTNEWTFPESYVVDTGANRVVMHIDHFTDFALTGGAGYLVYLPSVLKQ
jgi:protocatechuate 3,4-dioxygenase beta subunit